MTTAVLGTMTFGDTVTEAGAARIVDTAIGAGLVEFDTAVTYAGGAAEQILGRILPSHGERVRVSSKVGMQKPEHGGPLSITEVLRCARLSVGRLGRPLDTLYVHQPDRSTPVAETAEGLAAVLEEGLATRLGVSNHASWRFVELAAACRTAGIFAPGRAQQLYNPLARNLDVEFFDYAREHRIETIVYNPLAGGLLSGRHALTEPPSEGRFGNSKLAEMYRGRYWRDEYRRVVEDLRVIAASADISMVELCLRWAVSTDAVSSVLIGASRPEHVADNVEAIARGALPDDVRAAVDHATAAARELAPQYAR